MVYKGSDKRHQIGKSFLLGSLAFSALLPLQSWAFTELIVLYDITESSAIVREENQKGLELIIATLPENWCLRVFSITEESFSNPQKLINRTCIPKAQYLIDPKPSQTRGGIMNEWKRLCNSIKFDRQWSDVLGAISYAARAFSRGRKESHAKVLLIFSDFRHNTHGINLSGVPKIKLNVSSVIKRLKIKNRLKGTRIFHLGFHTHEKDQLYIDSLENFWKDFFDKLGASFEPISFNSDSPVDFPIKG